MNLMKPVLVIIFLTVISNAWAADEQVEFTLLNKAYQDLRFPMKRVDRAVLNTLKQMKIEIVDQMELVDGRRINAETEILEIEIEIFQVASKITKITADASEKKFIYEKDRETAAEIINQTHELLKRH